MITKVIIRKILLIVALFNLILGASACGNTPNPNSESTSDSSFLDLLQYVPDTPNTRQELYYADIHVAVETRLGTRQLNTIDEWSAASEEQQQWWLKALPQTYLYQASLIHVLRSEDATIVFDLLSIDQVIGFGRRPFQGFVLNGDFDNSAIVNTYASMGWEIVNNDDNVTLLCSIEGCENGLQENLEEISRANPFGGELGRIEPIALGNGFILNSPDISIVQSMLETGNNNISSLADAPEIQTAVQVVAEQGLIRQAAIFAPQEIASNPTFHFFMIAETADLEAETQTAYIVLVFNEAELAQAARTTIEANLQLDGTISERQRRPMREVMDAYGDLNFQILESNTYHILLISLQGQLTKADEQVPGARRAMLRDSGLQFRLLLSSIHSRDMAWISPAQ